VGDQHDPGQKLFRKENEFQILGRKSTRVKLFITYNMVQKVHYIV